MAGNKEDMEKWYVNNLDTNNSWSVNQDQIVKDFIIDKIKYVVHDNHWWKKVKFVTFGLIN